MIQRIKVRVRNRMTRNKATQELTLGMLGQCSGNTFVHRSVRPAGRGPCSDSTRAWVDPHSLLGREEYRETVLQEPVMEHCFPSLSNERCVLMISHISVNDIL